MFDVPKANRYIFAPLPNIEEAYARRCHQVVDLMHEVERLRIQVAKLESRGDYIDPEDIDDGA